MYQMSDKQLIAKLREIVDALAGSKLTRAEACRSLRNVLVESYQEGNVHQVTLDEVKDMGNIEAVKYIRSKMGLGLRESLDYLSRLLNKSIGNSFR